MDGAIKIAVYNRIPSLAERINQIKELKLQEAEDAYDNPKTAFDIKAYIQREVQNRVAETEYLSPPIEHVSKEDFIIEDDKMSEVIVTSSAKIFKDESQKQPKIQSSSASSILNPFAIKPKEGIPAPSNGKVLLSAIAQTAKKDGNFFPFKE